MAEQVSTTVSFAKWTLTTQADIDECAEELWADHHVASNVRRGWDEHGVDFRRLDVFTENAGSSGTAEIGQIVIHFNGQPEVLTPDQYAARGFAEGGS